MSPYKPLVKFSNSDWKADIDDQNSTYVYLFQLSSRPLFWSCKKQKVVSRLTIEEKYHDDVNAGMKEVSIFLILTELDFPIQSLTIIHCDSQSTIEVVDNYISHNKMKHVELHVQHLT